jgi:superfamily I DNA and/or RNA helicase
MRVFWAWKSTLDAMTDLEQEREAPVEYSDWTQTGRRIEFTLKQVPDEDPVGKFRQVQLKGGGYLGGEVIALRGRILSLLPEYGQPERVPHKGLLRVDTWPSRKAILGQRTALDAVIYKRALRSDLGDLIMQPDRARTPVPADGLSLRNPNLDEPKRRSVAAALGSRDLLLVQGSPGTGKTTFITELVLQEIERNPRARILIASQTHAALDNVLERLARAHTDLRLLRVARLGDPRVSDHVIDFLLDRQLARWRENVIRQGRQYLRSWAKEQGVSERGVEISVLYEDLTKMRIQRDLLTEEIHHTDDQLQRLREQATAVRRETREDISDMESRRQELTTMMDDLQSVVQVTVARLIELRELQTAEEVADLTPAELERRSTDSIDRNHPSFQRCRELITILSDWHARFGRSDEFQGAALLRSNVVAATCLGLKSVKGAEAIEFDLCIVDEASKAASTELLVPMAQARRWVLVGDPKQLPPFVEHALLRPPLLAEHELSENDVRETLFDRLWASLPAACKTKLTVQHRMVAPIGDLISACFYDDELENGVVKELDGVGLVLPAPVSWFTTASLSHREEKAVGTSRANPAEARFIKQLLGRLNFYGKGARRPLSVAVLTGYQGQQELIEREMADSTSTWDSLERVECMTVNSFQGREADIAVYSVTRCNRDGKLGFVGDPPRLNVALSRGRFGLAIVGDHIFAEAAGGGGNPFCRVLDWIRAHPDCAEIVEVDR